MSKSLSKSRRTAKGGKKSAPAVSESILATGRSNFTVEEFRREFRLSRATGYRLVVGFPGHPPVVPSIRLGHSLRIPRAAIEKIVAGELPAITE